MDGSGTSRSTSSQGEEILSIVEASQTTRFSCQQEELLRRCSSDHNLLMQAAVSAVASALEEAEEKEEEEDTKKHEETSACGTNGMKEESAALEGDGSDREVLEIVRASQTQRFSLQQQELLRRFSDPDFAKALEELDLSKDDETSILEEKQKKAADASTNSTNKQHPKQIEEKLKEKTTDESLVEDPEHPSGVVTKEDTKEQTPFPHSSSESLRVDQAKSRVVSGLGPRTKLVGDSDNPAAADIDGAGDDEASIIMDPPTLERRELPPSEHPGAYSVSAGHSSLRTLSTHDDDDLRSNSDVDSRSERDVVGGTPESGAAEATATDDEMHMVEAQLVVDASQHHRRDQDTTTIIRADAVPEPKLVQRRIANLPLLAIIVLLVVGLVVAISVAVSNGSDQASSTPTSATAPSTTSSNSSSPSTGSSSTQNQTRLVELRSFLTAEEITIDNALFDNPTTPQYQALRWLVFQDPAQVSLLTHGDYRVIQRYVLAVLYYSTGGNYWENSLSFLTGDHECNWKYVTEKGEEKGVTECGQNWGGGVSNLLLWWNNLTGTMPEELGALTTLQQLSFAINNLKGSIPTSLGKLPNAEWLFLNNNQLEGTVPSQLANIPRLGAVGLFDNPNLTGSLDFFCQGQQPLFLLNADCAGTTPKIDCPCCSECCDMELSECCPPKSDNVTYNADECWDPTPVSREDAFA